MKKLLEYILTKIVDHPDKLSIEEKQTTENLYQFVISADKDDTGKIIGKQGKIISALRNIIKILAIKENKQIFLEIRSQLT